MRCSSSLRKKIVCEFTFLFGFYAILLVLSCSFISQVFNINLLRTKTFNWIRCVFFLSSLFSSLYVTNMFCAGFQAESVWLVTTFYTEYSKLFIKLWRFFEKHKCLLKEAHRLFTFNFYFYLIHCIHNVIWIPVVSII